MNQEQILSDYNIEADDQGDSEKISRQLLDLISRHDQEAFLSFYDRFKIPIYNFVFRLVQEHYGAEDITQEVFLAVWKGAHKFRGRSKVKTWIYRIAYYQSVSWYRHHPSIVNLEGVDDMP